MYGIRRNYVLPYITLMCMYVCRSVVGRSLFMSCYVFVPLCVRVRPPCVCRFVYWPSRPLLVYVHSVRLTFWTPTFSHEMPPHLYVPCMCMSLLVMSVRRSLGVHVSVVCMSLRVCVQLCVWPFAVYVFSLYISLRVCFPSCVCPFHVFCVYVTLCRSSMCRSQ